MEEDEKVWNMQNCDNHIGFFLYLVVNIAIVGKDETKKRMSGA